MPKLIVLLLLLLISHAVSAADLLTSPGNNNAEFLEKWFDDKAKKDPEPVFSQEEKAELPATPVSSELLTSALAENKGYFRGQIVWKNLPIKPLLESIYPGINTQKIFVDPENNLWERHESETFAPSRGKTLQEAIEICRELNFYGLTDFRLPTQQELAVINGDFPFSSSAEFFSRNYWSSTRVQDQVVTLEKFKNRGFENMNPTRHEDFRCITSFFRTHGLEAIAKMIVHRELSAKEVLALPEKPEPPKMVTPAVLEKGEFETTDEFNARKQQEQERVNRLETQNKESHQSTLKHWQQQVKAAKTAHQKKLSALAADMENIKQSSLQEAMSIKYGIPAFSSVQYDADHQTFEIKITGNRNNLEETLALPVERSIARTFKEAILSDHFKIGVVFNYSGDGLELQTVGQFDNPRLIVDKYLLHLAYDSIEKLKVFLSEDHLPEVMALARKRLAELEGQQ